MKWITCSLAILAATALMASAGFAATACTTASLVGECTFQSVGSPSTTGAANDRGPIAVVGQMTFDGAGNVTMDEHANIDGVYHENESGTGTYTIGSDCDGVINITYPIPGGSRTVGMTFVLSQNGTTLRTINSSNTEAPSGPLNEVEAGICRFNE